MLTYVFLAIVFLLHPTNESVNRINATVMGSKQTAKEVEVEGADPAISGAGCIQDGGVVDAAD